MTEAQTHEAFARARREMRAAGRAVWLAGLGAIAGVDKERREIRQTFDHLVERGRPAAERQRKVLDEIGVRTGATAREMKQLFEDTVHYESKSLLKRLGLTTRDDVNALAARIDSLAARVDELVAVYTERQS